MIYRLIPARWRAPIGWWLRCLADDIDWTFTFEPHRGVVFHSGDSNRGCPIAYMAEDYDLAHTEAGMNVSLADPAVQVTSAGFVWNCPNCPRNVSAPSWQTFLEIVGTHCDRDCPTPGREVSGSFVYGGRTFRLGGDPESTTPRLDAEQRVHDAVLKLRDAKLELAAAHLERDRANRAASAEISNLNADL